MTPRQNLSCVGYTMLCINGANYLGIWEEREGKAQMRTQAMRENSAMRMAMRWSSHHQSLRLRFNLRPAAKGEEQA